MTTAGDDVRVTLFRYPVTAMHPALARRHVTAPYRRQALCYRGFSSPPSACQHPASGLFLLTNAQGYDVMDNSHVSNVLMPH